MISLELRDKILKLDKEDKEEIIQIIWEELTEEDITLSKKHIEILEKRYDLFIKRGDEIHRLG